LNVELSVRVEGRRLAQARPTLTLRLTNRPTYVLVLFVLESDQDRAERHGRILAELAEVGMKAVRDLSDALEEATTVVDKERLALSLHRMSRDLRLTLAMEERLVHQRRKAFREEKTDRQKAVEHRKKQVDHAVTGRVYAEREGEAAEALLKDFDDLLDEHRLYEDFLDLPLEAVIAKFCKMLGLAEFPANDAAAGEASRENAPPPQARAGPS
jgi:hypothetical protein